MFTSSQARRRAWRWCSSCRNAACRDRTRVAAALRPWAAPTSSASAERRARASRFRDALPARGPVPRRSLRRARRSPRSPRSPPMISFSSQPLYTFGVAHPQELIALLIFLGVAVLTGSLTGRVRDQRESVIKNAEIMRSLYDYSRKLSGASSADDVLWAAAAHLHATFGGRIALLVAEGDSSPDLGGLAARRPARRSRDDGRPLGPAEERAGRGGARARCRASSTSSVRSSPRAGRSPFAALSRIRPSNRSARKTSAP